MLSFLTEFEINVIVGVASCLAGVAFSTKIKDFFKGVPSDVRTALNNVEADALAKVSAAKASVIASLPGAPAKTAAPAAAAPAPAPAPAPQA